MMKLDRKQWITLKAGSRIIYGECIDNEGTIVDRDYITTSDVCVYLEGDVNIEAFNEET